MKTRKLKTKNLVLLIIIGIAIVGVSTVGVLGFLDKEDSNRGQTSKEPDKGKEPDKVEPKVQIVDGDSKTRPFAVMINNLAAARPYHTGLQDAYLVYEIVVEGGITRYLALFKDKYPEMVGSVRSARHYYLDYALENDAYYVHWGWSPQAQKDISSLKINNLNGLSNGTPYFFREKLAINSEHTGYVNLKEMTSLVTKKGYRSETTKPLLLNYSPISVNLNDNSDKVVANEIDLKYSKGFTTNYVYDKDLNAYKQYVNDKEHKDYKTKEQYTVKNIIVYKVANKTISGDDKGRQDLDNLGSGEGYYISEGYSIPITWSKKSREAQTEYKLKDGTKLEVNDGNTWIHIIPEVGNIGIS